MLAAACMSLGTALAEPAPRPPPAPVVVTVRTAGRDGLWRARYRFSRPVSGLRFHRNAGLRRAPAWRVETPGYALRRDGQVETVVLAAGARPRREIAIAFPVDTSHPEKDYQLFERFSDGSLLLYTGHLNVVPGGSGDPMPPHHFRLSPPRGRHLVVEGRLSRGRRTWNDAAGEGTFVYYGALMPLESRHTTALLDPALPHWMRRRMSEAIPALFADFERLTGFALSGRPTVLLSFRAAADPRSTSWKGGTLPGIIQMHVEAAADAPEDAVLLRRFFKFLAHEAAHLWNGQLFESAGSHQSWMHEGGADAFAWRAMRRAGLFDEAELEQRQAEDLNRCLADLGPDPLRVVEERREFRAVYTCGSALAWLTEAAVRRADPPADLHSFWAALFRAAQARGHRYDEALYLEVLRQRGADPATVAFIAEFLNQAMPDRPRRTLEAFRAAGLALEPSTGPLPGEHSAEWGERALAALMRHDCGGAYSISRQGRGFVLNALPSCRTLKTALPVEGLEGHALRTTGERAYDALVERCASGGTVSLSGPGLDAPVTVPCRMEARPRPAWLSIARPPETH